jgi:hypothetical protein
MSCGARETLRKWFDLRKIEENCSAEHDPTLTRLRKLDKPTENESMSLIS